MKPSITALVDTYNQDRYIEQALVSVIEQDLPASEFEVIVVDDGSTDKTSSIVRKFLPRIRYLRKNNAGQASAFNVGFAEVKSDIVSLLDGDDWWAKGKIATVLHHLDRNPSDLAVSHAYYEVHEEAEKTQRCGPKEQPEFLDLSTPEAARKTKERWNFLQPSALTVRRQLWERVIPIPEALIFCADSPIVTAAMAVGVKVLPQELSFYRIHSDNLYAGEFEEPVRLHRKLKMDEVMFSILYPRLVGLGVNAGCVSALLDQVWIESNRRSLRTFGGSHLKTWRTEMRNFSATYKSPTLTYRLFKYLVMSPATLLLPPKLFYKAQDWYAVNNLKRFRDRLFKTDKTPPR